MSDKTAVRRYGLHFDSRAATYCIDEQAAGGFVTYADYAALKARWEELRPLLGMMGGGDDFAGAVRAIREASDQYFLQACENGGAANEERARAKAAEAERDELQERIDRALHWLD